MNSVMNKIRLAEKRYRGKVNEDKKENRIDTRNIKKILKVEKVKRFMKNIIISNYKKKKTTNYKRKYITNWIKEEL